MGDVIHTFPAVRLLRNCFPDANLAWLVNDVYAELVERSPDVDEVITFKRNRYGKPRNWPELIVFCRELRQRNFDIAIDFQGLLRSSLIAYFSGAKQRIGFRQTREGASLLYTEKILLPANVRHAIEKNAFLVRAAFGTSECLEMPPLLSYPRAAQAAKSLVGNAMEDHPPVLVVAPASRWASKTWPPAFFADVIRQVNRQTPEAVILLIGTQAERQIGESIAEKCRDAGIINLMGDINFGILIELFRESHVILTNDSGPMHLAAALGIAVVAMFGPTDPELTGPRGASRQKVYRGDCHQAPCFLKNCPVHEQVCHRGIDPNEVANTISTYLKEMKKNAAGITEDNPRL